MVRNLLGTDDARDSLAAKLWMIDNARHTIDAIYYIFRDDLAGRAMLAAMCDAVIRGVDVRLVVDSLGSLSTDRTALGWLEVCEENAGWMRNADGEVTNRRARVQVVVFNAVSKLSTSPNRRSHDKLLVMDGTFPDRSMGMTGGRNIAVDYYGFDAEGARDPNASFDSELLLAGDPEAPAPGVGRTASAYFSLLFHYRGNRLIGTGRDERLEQARYNALARSYDALEALRGLELMAPHFEAMDVYMTDGFRPVDTRLAHEMANLDDRRVVRNVEENFAGNPNSVLYLLLQRNERMDGTEQSRIVSPYLFLALYRDKDGNVLLDEAERIRQWIEENPESSFEVVTNSVLTSDNFPAQSVIDFDTAPRLLLTPELREQWLALDTKTEAESELVNSPEWQAAVNHPRLVVWETGRLDAALLPGGTGPYGKLHAKFWQEEDIGFIGTTNFDYRSRLYNNEMGYFFRGEALAAELVDDFEWLKSRSLRWGSPEWLEMRRQVRALDGAKGRNARIQRATYRTLRATGLKWLF